MHEIKETVRGNRGPNQRGNTQSTDHCHRRECDTDHNFPNKRVPGPSHHCKENVVRRNDDENGGIETTILVKSYEPGQTGDRQGNEHTGHKRNQAYLSVHRTLRLQLECIKNGKQRPDYVSKTVGRGKQ